VARQRCEPSAERDYHPDWVAGISIGAINRAIIARNAPEEGEQDFVNSGKILGGCFAAVGELARSPAGHSGGCNVAVL
jgi:hypothetical protein